MILLFLNWGNQGIAKKHDSAQASLETGTIFGSKTEKEFEKLYTQFPLCPFLEETSMINMKICMVWCHSKEQAKSYQKNYI